MSGARLYASFEDLRRSAPTALAVHDVDRGTVLDRDALSGLVDRVAASLGAGGLPRGARVGLQVPNSPELFAAVLACWREGWVPAPLDRELTAVEVAAVAERLALASVRIGTELREAAPRSAADAGPGLVVPAGAALLKLTSGSTGEPRGVALTAAAVAAGGAQILSTMGIRPEDRNLVTIPLAHSYGFDNVLVALALAGTAAILTADLTPPRLVSVAREQRATVLPSVPFLLDLLSRSSARGALPSLRLVISAGAPLPRETRERFHAGFGLRPRSFYGSTECGGITFDREGRADLAEGCVGTPLDGVAIDLVEGDEDAGRIAVRGASVGSGYVPAREDGAAAVLGEGRFLTSDVGRIDAEGRLHLLGRAVDVVNVGGRKVYPAEVERVVRAVPGVRDAVVIGVARSGVAATLRAVIEASPEVTREEVVAACERSLARYKVPRLVDLRSELPRTARGKIDRSRLA
jgi:long-chain acyl-CoA synthetase